MTPISVLIPTANRPAMLRTALRSVAAQTALAHVAEVVVIENLGNRDSEGVCREFAQLPIRYYFRDPPIPPGIETTRDAVSRVRCDRMAILFDDDWWMDDHLENAICSLEGCSEAVASYCSYILTTGEDGYMMKVGNSFIPWFAASKTPVNHRWVLDLPDLLVASQIGTAFSFMTLLTFRDVWAKCIECFAHGNPYDTDRLISVELGRYGKVICDSRPHVYVRHHDGQEERRLKSLGVGAFWWKESTRRLIEVARTEGIDLAHEFSTRMAAKGVDTETLRLHACHDAIDDLLNNGILSADHTSSFPRRAYRSLMPPILQNVIRRVRSRIVRID